MIVTRYRITLRHDAGRVQITTVATSRDAAVSAVLTAESAPRRAVVAVETLERVA